MHADAPPPIPLSSKIVRGGAILVVLRLSIRLIGLVSTMILFRILVPDDFGLVSLAMSVIGLAEVLAEFGFDQALIQRQNAQRRDYDLAWSLTLIRGVFCSFILVLIAYPAADFLNDARLAPMIMWLALAPLIDGIQNIGIVEYTKELRFGKELTFKVSQKLVGFFVTLFLAFWLRNYWALVIGILVGKGAGLLISYAMHTFRPTVTIKGWQGIFKFSVWIMFNHVSLYIGNQTDKVLLQKYFDAHAVGIFRVAEELCSIVMELVWPVEKALYSAYAKLSNSLDELRKAMLNSVGIVALIGVPASIGIMVIAEPLVLILLGEKGREAIPFVEVLVLHGAIRSCTTGVLPVFTALGKPHLNYQITIASVVSRLIALFIGFPILGVMAAPWSLVIGSIVGFIGALIQSARLLNFRWNEMLLAIWRAVIGATIMAITTKYATVKYFSDIIIHNNFILIAAQIFVGAAIYMASVLLMWQLSGRNVGAESRTLEFLRQRISR